VDVNGFATGALQVFLDDAFGAVCGNLFGPLDAQVACRQMGFVGGTIISRALRSSLHTEVSFEEDYQVNQQVLQYLPCLRSRSSANRDERIPNHGYTMATPTWASAVTSISTLAQM